MLDSTDKQTIKQLEQSLWAFAQIPDIRKKLFDLAFRIAEENFDKEQGLIPLDSRVHSRKDCIHATAMNYLRTWIPQENPNNWYDKIEQ